MTLKFKLWGYNHTEKAQLGVSGMSVLMVTRQEVLKEGQAPKTYRELFSECLDGAEEIQLSEPYIRLPYQVENLRSFIDLFDGPVKIKLTTTESTGRTSEFTQLEQRGKLKKVVDYAMENGTKFSYQFDNNEHVRKIVTNTGWIIKSDRGLHIYRPNGSHKKTEIDYIQKERQPIIEFNDLHFAESSITIDNITSRDVENRKIRIRKVNTFLFPSAENNQRTVYNLLVSHKGQRFDASYAVGSNDGRNRSPVLKLYRELFDDIKIGAGTILTITKSPENTYTIEKKR